MRIWSKTRDRQVRTHTEQQICWTCAVNRIRYSNRTMLLLVTIVCVIVGAITRNDRRERAVVRELTRRGALVMRQREAVNRHPLCAALFSGVREVYVNTNRTPPEDVPIVLRSVARLPRLEQLTVVAGLTDQEFYERCVATTMEELDVLRGEKEVIPPMLRHCKDELRHVQQVFPDCAIIVNCRPFGGSSRAWFGASGGVEAPRVPVARRDAAGTAPPAPHGLVQPERRQPEQDEHR